MINRNRSIPWLHNFPFPANWPEKENKRIFEIRCLKMGSSLVTDDNVNSYAETVIDILKHNNYESLLEGCRISAKKYTIDNMVKNFKNGVIANSN